MSRRQDPSPYRVAVLDGLRAFALGGVVIFHLLGISGVLTTGGRSWHEWAIWTVFGNTLDIFFIMSGFALFLPVIRRGGEIGRVSDWYLKRFGRLQPEYWACLVVLLLMLFFIPVDFPPTMPGAGSVLIHFLDLQSAARMIDPNLGVGFFVDGALWMVPVIAGLYLIFPLVARPFYRHVWAGLAIAALITVSWKLAPVHFPGIFQWLSRDPVSDETIAIIAHDQTPSYIFSFAAGMAAAWIFVKARNDPGNPWIPRGVLLAFLIGIPAYVLFSIPYTEAALDATTGFDGSSRGRGLAFNGLASTTVRVALILGIILGPLWIQRPFANRAVTRIAELSFGIYLIHLPIAVFAAQLFTISQTGGILLFGLWCAVVLPPATLYAWCSRKWVGQPSIRAVERWIARRRSRAPLPGEH